MKNFLCLTALLFVIVQTSWPQEFLLHEETFTWTKDADACGGYHYWYDIGNAPSTNWKTPYDFQNGLYYFRFEVISQPSSDPFKLNMCIWTEYNAGVWKEECTGMSPVMGGAGSKVTFSTPVTYQLNGVPIDWTNLSKLWRMGNPIFVNGHNLGPNEWCTANPEEWVHVDQYFPMTLRMTIVAVASGYTFSGWANYPVGGGCTPVQQPTPSYSIDYINESTNKIVPSTDEYSYHADMSDAFSGNGQKLALIPGQTVYFRTKKASDCLLASNVQTLIVPARPAVPSVSVDFINESTVENIGSTIDYSASSSYTNPITGEGNKISLTPGQDLYFWVKATASSFYSLVTHLTVPNRPATPAITIDFANERTSAVPATMEWSTSLSMTSATSGTTAPITVTPGTDLYFRVKSTAGSFASAIQSLNVPDRPAAPSVTVDFANETTAENIGSTIDYSASSSYTNPITGTGNIIALTPGQDLYFWEKATASSFYSLVTHLTVPNRPATPAISVDYTSETTNEPIGDMIEFSANPDMSSFVNGSNVKLQLIPGVSLYFRIKATTASFKSQIQSLVIPNRPSNPSFDINYADQTTSMPVTAEYEYANDSSMSNAVSGTNEKVQLTPGHNLYIRKMATGTSFASLIQELKVPLPPDAPYYSIDFVRESTVENIPTICEYDTTSDMFNAVAGSDTTISLIPGKDYYFRLKSTDSSFTSRIMHLVTPERPLIKSSAGDTIQNDYFTAFVEFPGAVTVYDTTALEAENARILILDSDSIKIIPINEGTVTVKINANALQGGSFASESFITYFKQSVTSIYDKEELSGLMQIFPNPVTDVLNISIAEKNILPLKILLMDAIGTIMIQKFIYSTFEPISMNWIPEGLYILDIIDANGKVTVFKIIKQ